MTKNVFILVLGLLTLSSCNLNKKKIHTEWIFVEGGRFEQGENQFIISPKGDSVFGFTSPNREIVISDFYISKYEITVGEFKVFCKRTGRSMPEPPDESAHGITVNYSWKDKMPMLATWEEADAYAKWAGGRLPTEAEWEYAAKGGQKSKGYRYSGSNIATEVGWVGENSDSTFHAVGQRMPNELGLHDMTGNVSEWVSDWYNPDLDHLSKQVDPTGPEAGVDKMKISKGLSWFYDSCDKDGNPLEYGIHMPEVRYQSPVSTRNDGFGFRIAKDK